MGGGGKEAAASIKVEGRRMIDYALFSHKGERDYNEDSIAVVTNPALFTYGFVLADGLGGHGRGKDASRTVTDYISAAVQNTDTFHGLFIDECFDRSQEFLLKEQKRLGCPGAMKTTLTFLMINDKKVSWGHIGDSRIYFFRENQLMERTKDHSMVQALVDAKKLKEKKIRNHPDRSKLLKAMGTEWNGPEYDIDRRNIKINSGDTFLLCSDGFWEWITEKTMLRILKKTEDAQEALQSMVDQVYKVGAGKNMDNCSAILIRVK